MYWIDLSAEEDGEIFFARRKNMPIEMRLKKKFNRRINGRELLLIFAIDARRI